MTSDFLGKLIFLWWGCKKKKKKHLIITKQIVFFCQQEERAPRNVQGVPSENVLFSLVLPNRMGHYLHLNLSVRELTFCQRNVLIKIIQQLEAVISLQFSTVSDRSQVLLALTRLCLGWAAPFGAEIHRQYVYTSCPGRLLLRVSPWKEVFFVCEFLFFSQCLLAQHLQVGLRVTQFPRANQLQRCSDFVL